MSSISDVVGHYQRSIEKSAHDEARLLHCIEKLYKLPITVEHLQQTGIGKTVNALRKYEKEVGIAAKALVAKWKAMVAAEEELVNVNDTPKVNGNDEPNSDNENYNGSQYSQETEHGNHDSNHKYKQSSSRNEKPSDVDRKERRHKENGREDSRNHSQHSTSDSKKMHNVLSDRHNRDKPNSSSSSKHHREKHSSNENRHHNDRRKEDKVKSSSNHSSRKAPTPEPAHESPPIASDDNLYENDSDDEDEEKLIIDTEHNKEKIEEIDRESHRKSSKSSKSSNRHKSSSSKRSSSEDNQASEHESKKKSRHESKDRDKKESSKSSSSKSRGDEKRDKDKSNDRHHKSSKNDEDKSTQRRNGEHKSSSSLKSKSNDKSKDEEKHSIKSDSPKSSKDKSRSKESGSSNKKSSKRKHESDDDSESVEEQTSPKKSKSSRKADDDGIDNSMGNLSFEEALGMMAPPSKAASAKLKSPKGNGVSSKTPSVTSSRNVASSSNSSRSKTPPLLTTKIKLEPLDPKLSLELPIISPNYKPLPLNPTVMDCVFANNTAAKPAAPTRRLMTDDEALQSGISSKTIRTKIYSGMKTGAILQVPTLFKLCLRVLQKNIDALEYTGGVPYEVLKPVLELASPEQLYTFEEFNDYLIGDTDDLWRVHCSRRYKSQKRREMESWRDMFTRCKEQQEERLNLLTKNITFQQKQITAPIKRTQLAYVDVDVKPPRNVQRKQEQYGTKGKAVATPAARVEALKQVTPSAAKIGDTRLRVAAEVRDHAQASSHIRPKKAPLMQKTLQLMKGRFKR